MPPSYSSDWKPRTQETRQLPVEIELFIEPDGAVVFADLAADAVPIARRLTDRRKSMFESLIQTLRDWLAIWPLRWQVSYLKLRTYDHLENGFRESQETIRSLERAAWRLNRRIEAQETQIAELEHEKEALANRSPLPSPSVREVQLAIFRYLHPIMMELSTWRMAAEEGKKVSPEDILERLALLDEAVEKMGFRPFGSPGETMPFDPERHRAVGKGARSVKPGDAVRVLHVGYSYGDDVVYKAHVTRVDNELIEGWT
jgi:hypothetical protein